MNTTEDQKVQKVASVAPATITQVSRQVLEPVKRKRIRAGSMQSLREEMLQVERSIKVHPMVWSTARQILADGSYTRIEIIDHETVVVR